MVFDIYAVRTELEGFFRHFRTSLPSLVLGRQGSRAPAPKGTDAPGASELASCQTSPDASTCRQFCYTQAGYQYTVCIRQSWTACPGRDAGYPLLNSPPDICSFPAPAFRGAQGADPIPAQRLAAHCVSILRPDSASPALRGRAAGLTAGARWRHGRQQQR